MYWMITSLMLAAEPSQSIEKIYVAPPTIHDEELQPYQDYIGSLLVSSANTNSHWVKLSKRADDALIYDFHWVLVTDIFTTKNFATIVVKLYDEDTQLIASSSKSSYAIEECKEQIKKVTISQQGKPSTEITEQKPDKCILLKPSILDKDINQAITILFASIHPVK